MPPPRLQYIKDHCLAATTASASPIRPQIVPSKSNLSDLPLCEISYSSNLPRAARILGVTGTHLHASPILLTRRHAPTRACTRQFSPADVSPRWRHLPRHLPRHLMTSSATSSADVIIDQDVYQRWLWLRVDFDRWLFARVDFCSPGALYPVFRLDFIFAIYFASKWRIRTGLLLVVIIIVDNPANIFAIFANILATVLRLAIVATNQL